MEGHTTGFDSTALSPLTPSGSDWQGHSEACGTCPLALTPRGAGGSPDEIALCSPWRTRSHISTRIIPVAPQNGGCPENCGNPAPKPLVSRLRS